MNHVLGARLVLHDGKVVDIGGPALDAPGHDLLAALVGSEGMLGIVTEVTLRLLRKPEATRTFFATFPSTDEGGEAVSRIIAAGILPAAIEMMDRLAIEAAKAARSEECAATRIVCSCGVASHAIHHHESNSSNNDSSHPRDAPSG